MITGKDIDRMVEEKEGVQLVIVDTKQFFEFEIPVTQDPEDFLNSAECRAECAARILNQTTDLNIDRVLTNFNEDTQIWEK